MGLRKKGIGIEFEYKVKMWEGEKGVDGRGLRKIRDVEGKDLGEMKVFLEKGWEEKEGNMYGKGVGRVVVGY